MAEESEKKQQLNGDPPENGDPPTKSDPPANGGTAKGGTVKSATAKGGTAKGGIHSNLHASILTETLPEGLNTYDRLPFSTISCISDIRGLNPPLSKTGDDTFTTGDKSISCTFYGLLKQLKASRTQLRWALKLLKRSMSKTPIGLVNMSQFLSRLMFISNEADEKHLDKMRDMVHHFLALFKIREKDKSKQTTSSFLKDSTDEKKKSKKKSEKSEKKKSHKCKGNEVEDCQAGVAVEPEDAVQDCQAGVAFEPEDTFSFISKDNPTDVLLAFILAVLAVEPTSSRETFDPLQQLELERLEKCQNFAEILFNMRLPVLLGIAISSARYQESKMQGSEEETFYASEAETCDMFLHVLREYGTISWNVPAQAQAQAPASKQEQAPAPSSEQEQAQDPSSEQEALFLAHVLASQEADTLAETRAPVETLVKTIALANALAQRPYQGTPLVRALDLATDLHPAQAPASQQEDSPLAQALNRAQGLAQALDSEQKALALAYEQAQALARDNPLAQRPYQETPLVRALDLATALPPAPASEQKASPLAKVLTNVKDLDRVLTEALHRARALTNALNTAPAQATDLINALYKANAFPPAQATPLVQALDQALPLAVALTKAQDPDIKNLTNNLDQLLALSKAQDPILALTKAFDKVLALTKARDPALEQIVVLARAMALAQAPTQSVRQVNRTSKTILKLFNDMCNCVSLLSMRFNVLQTEELSKSVSMGLALMQKIFHSALGDCLKTGLDGPFFKNVLQVLSVNHQDHRIMQDIQSQIEYFRTNWVELCRRAGLSFERKKILLFLQCLYGQDLKGCLIILKTFIGSGKTASLCLYLLLTLMKGETAIYISPSLNEILRFFSGIIHQIRDLIYSDEFKALPNSNFKTEMNELHEKLRTLDVYTKPFKFGEVQKPDRMCVFLLAPTIENFGYALGKSNECKVYIFDDVRCSHALAKELSENGSKSEIVIAGADVQDCKKKEFPNRHICSLNIQKPIDVKKILGDARLVQDAGFPEFLRKNFLTKHTSELISSFVKMGINVDGSATIIDDEINSLENFFPFLRLVSCDYDQAFMKVKHHYTQSMMMNLHERKKDHDKIVVMQSGEIPDCLSAFVSGVFSVHDDGTHVPNDFSCSKRNHGVVGGDIVLDVKEPKKENPSTVNKEKDISASSDSVPTTVCGGGVAVRVPSSKKTSNPTYSKITTKGLRDEADNASKTSVELPKRPATFRDVKSGKGLVNDTNMKYMPKQPTISEYCRLVNSLPDLTSDVKTVLKAIFANGGGFVHKTLPLHHNTFVANVFAKNELTYLSTNYALESMNLGHVSMIVLLCSISEKDLRQLLGRMNRPNSGTFFQLVEDGRLVVLSLDQFCSHAQNRDGNQRTGDDSQNVPCFIDFRTQCSSLGIQVISEPILEVLANLFRTYSDMFPKTFQVQVEKLLTMAFIRCFCPEMHLADRRISDKDTGMLIGSCVNLDESVIPIRYLSEPESLTALNKRYGTDDPDVLKYFKRFIHLLPLICAKTPSDLQPLDDINKMEYALEQIRLVLNDSRFASVVVSMTTPIMADKTQKHREWMSIVASILESTTTHLGNLISLLEAKLISHNESLEKAKVSIGAIVSTKKVDQVSIEFSNVSTKIFEGLLDGTIPHSDAISLVLEFITSKRSDATEKVIQKAQEFLEALSGFSPSICESLDRLLQKQQILRQKKRCRDVLKLRWMWAMGSNGSTRIQMLTSLLKLGPTADTVLLATKNPIVKTRVMYNTVLPTVYSKLRNFLTECCFLQGGQCENPVDAGNNTMKVSATSFENLKNAIERFDKQQSENHPIFREEINQAENDALVAEISVLIDTLQQEVSSLIDEVSLQLRKLYHFTK